MKHSYQSTFGVLGFLLMSIASSMTLADASKQMPNYGIEVQGNLDIYYQYSPQGHVSDGIMGPQVLEGRYFDRNSSELTLNFAELIFKKKIGSVQMRVDFAGGEMVDQMSGGGVSSVTSSNPINLAANEPTRNITQAILSYQVTDRLLFSAGKFYTNIGFELTRAKENWQYSRSYLFNYGPFWHQGLSASYAFVPGILTATLYGLNGWDGRSSQQTNSDFTLAGNLNYVAANRFILNYNYIGGDEAKGFGRRELHELNALWKINEKYAVAIDIQRASQQGVNSRTQQWSGAALYLRGKFNDFYTLSSRIEYFDDADGFVLVHGMSGAGFEPQNITSLTLTNSLDLGEGLESRLEVRHEQSSSDKIFKGAEDQARKNQTSYALAFLYGF